MNIADPNIYEYITNFADDRTILTMLSVNKNFRDENLFRRITYMDGFNLLMLS